VRVKQSGLQPTLSELGWDYTLSAIIENATLKSGDPDFQLRAETHGEWAGQRKQLARWAEEPSGWSETSWPCCRPHVEVTSFLADLQRLAGLCLDHGIFGSNSLCPQRLPENYRRKNLEAPQVHLNIIDAHRNGMARSNSPVRRVDQGTAGQ